MAQVSVRVNGRDYLIACQDGEEQRLTELADYVNSRVGELVDSVGQVGEARLLLMASLMIADELSEAYHAAEAAPPGQPAPPPEAADPALDELAARIERIAAQLEKA
ncbi:MAG TPA: cell division protein ZapA [Alphaproteobacteria bacterium]|nr:cell division protein ZapA [Alphaproteobacteria bacterium]